MTPDANQLSIREEYQHRQKKLEASVNIVD
jgi:hypothetical protein